MKIYFSELFNDYMFEFGGHLFLMVHPSSLDPTKTAWAAMPVGMAETIDLICEVE